MSALLDLTFNLTVGQPVRILSGPFANQPAQVAKLSDDWGSVWVQDKGERVELITQLSNLAPVAPPPARAAGPDEEEPDEETVIQSPPT